MQDQQKQLIDKLKGSQNVLVTVSKDPSADQLAAAIGLTLALNKLDKHASAVFSGQVPSTIEFLRPEDTLETTTDSLRDFIIALDKSKADKLRYKVEDQVVRIFITPYRTSISEKDLDFSQGDFNVDIVIALGVQDQQHIDEAIQAHGRILHDAAVAVLALEGNPELGTLNIVDPRASSLSEMVASLVEALDHNLFDEQIATALLTGIVACTDRFSNDRTTPKTMSTSSILMAAGANQQLIATELDTPRTAAAPADYPDEPLEVLAPPREPGTLEIDHSSDGPPPADAKRRTRNEPFEEPEEDEQGDSEEPDAPQVSVNEDGQLVTEDADAQLPQISRVHATDLPENDDDATEPAIAPKEPIVTRERMVAPPSRDSLLSANTQGEEPDLPAEKLTEPSNDLPLLHREELDEPAADEDAEEAEAPLPELELPPVPFAPPAPEQPLPDLGLPAVQPFANNDQPAMPFPQASTDDVSTDQVSTDDATPNQGDTDHEESDEESTDDADTTVDTEKETITEIEQAVSSPHLEAKTGNPDEVSVDEARNAVAAALHSAGSTAPPDPIAALNAQPLGPELHPEQFESQSPQAAQPAPAPGAEPEQGQADWVNPTEQTLDMPLPPSRPPASSFPGVMPQQQSNNDHDTLPPPPPVPPPPIIPG